MANLIGKMSFSFVFKIMDLKDFSMKNGDQFNKYIRNLRRCLFFVFSGEGKKKKERNFDDLQAPFDFINDPKNTVQ